MLPPLGAAAAAPGARSSSSVLSATELSLEDLRIIACGRGPRGGLSLASKEEHAADVPAPRRRKRRAKDVLLESIEGEAPARQCSSHQEDSAAVLPTIQPNRGSARRTLPIEATPPSKGSVTWTLPADDVSRFCMLDEESAEAAAPEPGAGTLPAVSQASPSSAGAAGLTPSSSTPHGGGAQAASRALRTRETNPFKSYDSKEQKTRCEKAWLEADCNYMGTRLRDLRHSHLQARLMHEMLLAERSNLVDGLSESRSEPQLMSHSTSGWRQNSQHPRATRLLIKDAKQLVRDLQMSQQSFMEGFFNPSPGQLRSDAVEERTTRRSNNNVRRCAKRPGFFVN